MNSDGYKWHQELLYLEEIDNYRFCKHLVLPLCRKFMSVSGKSVPKKINIKICDEILEYSLLYQADSLTGFYYMYGSLLRLLLDTTRCRSNARGITLNLLIKNKAFNNSREGISPLLSEFSPKSRFKWVSLKSVRDNNLCVDAINQYAESVYDLIHSTALDIQAFLKREEKTDFMDYILDENV